MGRDPLIKGGVRRSQLITTYGTGAVVALGDESFMVAGIDNWNVDRPDVHEPRLESVLRVDGFILPPAREGKRDIPVVRFPDIHSCPTCKRLDRHRFFASDNDNKCGHCGTPLIPSRFIVACNHGHIDDFPYFEWLHKNSGHTAAPGTQHRLRIETGGTSTSLSDIVISCSCGVPARTMQGSFGREALRGIRTCTGRRPWLGDSELCNEMPRTLQRGASNGYFSLVKSSISIPPWSEGAFKELSRYWGAFRHMPRNALPDTIRSMGLANGTGYTVEDLVAVALERLQGEALPDISEDAVRKLRREEYDALVKGRAEKSADQDFVCIPVSGLSTAVSTWFDHVSQVKRLREVRTLESFTRLQPPSPADPPERRAPLSRSQLNWLPAIEVIGEGVFLSLAAGPLGQWELRPDVVERAERINRNYVERFERLDKSPDRVITPRLLLVHTLAHILIEQFSLEAGYSASSLRERLYISEDMAGLLIYTATTDAAGSLGGVVAEAEPERLEASLYEAIARASWCSADPLCIEAEATGVDSLNLAACHACILLPEVSCEEQNLYLDRGILVGTPNNPDCGFFASML